MLPVIRYFVKSLTFAVISWNYCFTRAFHEITKFPWYFVQWLNLCNCYFRKPLILAILLVHRTVNCILNTCTKKRLSKIVKNVRNIFSNYAKYLGNLVISWNARVPLVSGPHRAICQLCRLCVQTLTFELNDFWHRRRRRGYRQAQAKSLFANLSVVYYVIYCSTLKPQYHFQFLEFYEFSLENHM